MKLLLTGASGFLGRNFLLHLPADWEVCALYQSDASFPAFIESLRRPTISPVRCTLSDSAEVQAFFDAHGREWDACLYLGARVDIPWSVREPKLDLFENTGSLLNVLAHLRADRLLYFSSGAVYDGLQGEVHPDAPVAPTLPYAISKYASERYVEFARTRAGSISKTLIVRFFGAYGPYEAPHKIYTRLIRAFAIEGRHTYTIYGDGTNLIDAMYVDDAVDAVQRMLTGAHWNTCVNLAGGQPETIESLVRTAASALGVEPVVIEKHGTANESNKFQGSTAEMQELYGFRPRTSLAEGIQRFRDFLLRYETEQNPECLTVTTNRS